MANQWLTPLGNNRWLNYKGYIRTKVNGQWKAEHRLIAEQLIGRPLRSDEDVHHINGIKDDNRPENLQVVPKTEHPRRYIHRTLRRPDITNEAINILLDQGLTRNAVAKRLGVDAGTVAARLGVRPWPKRGRYAISDELTA